MRPKYHNWRRIKRITLGVVVIGVVIGILAWSAVTGWPDVREGDTVRIRSEILTADGAWIEGSEDVTVYVDATKTPLALYSAIARAKVDVPKTFAVAACPDHVYIDFGGYTAGPHAWEGIRGTVTVLEVLNR
ncbi:MAG: hypothetical protein RBG13Loki_0309 [Promethearchaeota archaeon CR_4]|nr:MAG: hypothetical protein RBG13Loki_0309 [Candidatus Lokiarchaeota archaeon CR_4]